MRFVLWWGFLLVFFWVLLVVGFFSMLPHMSLNRDWLYFRFAAFGIQSYCDHNCQLQCARGFEYGKSAFKLWHLYFYLSNESTFYAQCASAAAMWIFISVMNCRHLSR